jgi:ABC-type transport system involved in multi-copper enzyme maturation permease subunit
VLVVRWLAAWPPAIVVWVLLWTWWFHRLFIDDYVPGDAAQVGVVVAMGMAITIALVLTPALLAGSLAGDKIRGTLGLLLACRVSPLEIILGRLAGRLSVVAAFLLAGLPGLAFCASLNGAAVPTLGLLPLLPPAVAFGAGGLAMGMSSVTSRGRDALLVVYLLILGLLLTPSWAIFLPAPAQPWIMPLNPYMAPLPLLESADWQPALVTLGAWTALGVVGCAAGAWRLRPLYLRAADGDTGRWHRWRRWRVPPLGDQPMVWKEMHVESVKAFNRFVRWLNLFVAAAFLLASLVCSSLVAWGTWVDPSYADWAKDDVASWMGSFWATTGMAWLLQWSMGLRAAVAIASERERNTWDALLLSPLEGREIIRAKIAGSAYAWRGFLAAVALAWTLALACGAMPVGQYITLLATTLVVGIFMIVMGVWFSLSSRTATRAMTLTMVAWLVGAFVSVVLAFIIVGVLALVLFLTWLWWKSMTGTLVSALKTGGPLPAGLAWWEAANTTVQLLLYALAALLVAIYCWRRFDRLAGRSFLVNRLPGRASTRHRATRPAPARPTTPVPLNRS